MASDENDIDGLADRLAERAKLEDLRTSALHGLKRQFQLWAILTALGLAIGLLVWMISASFWWLPLAILTIACVILFSLLIVRSRILRSLGAAEADLYTDSIGSARDADSDKS